MDQHNDRVSVAAIVQPRTAKDKGSIVKPPRDASFRHPKIGEGIVSRIRNPRA